MIDQPQLSVVIPTLEAAATLPALLSDLASSGLPLEILVVDGGSSDETHKKAAEKGCRVLLTKPGRGQQLAAGANAAAGAWLLFLHADCRLPEEWDRAVVAFIGRPEPDSQAAHFQLKLDSTCPGARRVERLANWRATRLGLPYGDQGLLIHKELYAQVGGYPPVPLMEDVALVRRLGKRRLHALPLPLLTSAARYERDGWWRRPLRNLGCLTLYFLGASPEWLVRRYH